MSELTFEQKTTFVAPVKRFRAPKGRLLDLIPLLRKGQDEKDDVVDVPRVLSTPKEFVHERVHGEDETDRDILRNNYFDLGYVFIADPDKTGEVLLSHTANEHVGRLVNGINPKSELSGYGLKVGRDIYQEIREDPVNSLVLTADQANQLREKPYSLVAVREQVWDHMLEGDVQLRRDNLALNGGSIEEKMGVWPSSDGLRLLCVGSVGDYYSSAHGNLDLDDGLARPLGVIAPEARGAQDGTLIRPSLPEILAVTKDYVAPAVKAKLKSKLGDLYQPK